MPSGTRDTSLRETRGYFSAPRFPGTRIPGALFLIAGASTGRNETEEVLRYDEEPNTSFWLRAAVCGVVFPTGRTAFMIELHVRLRWRIDGMNRHTIDRRVCIGHVHLKASDLTRALDFDCGILGFERTQRWGSTAASSFRRRLSPSHRSQHVEVSGGSPPPKNDRPVSSRHPLPDRARLGDALRRLDRRKNSAREARATTA